MWSSIHFRMFGQLILFDITFNRIWKQTKVISNVFNYSNSYFGPTTNHYSTHTPCISLFLFSPCFLLLFILSMRLCSCVWSMWVYCFDLVILSMKCGSFKNFIYLFVYFSHCIYYGHKKVYIIARLRGRWRDWRHSVWHIFIWVFFYNYDLKLFSWAHSKIENYECQQQRVDSKCLLGKSLIPRCVIKESTLLESSSYHYFTVAPFVNLNYNRGACWPISYPFTCSIYWGQDRCSYREYQVQTC